MTSDSIFGTSPAAEHPASDGKYRPPAARRCSGPQVVIDPATERMLISVVSAPAQPSLRPSWQTATPSPKSIPRLQSSFSADISVLMTSVSSSGAAGHAAELAVVAATAAMSALLMSPKNRVNDSATNRQLQWSLKNRSQSQRELSAAGGGKPLNWPSRVGSPERALPPRLSCPEFDAVVKGNTRGAPKFLLGMSSHPGKLDAAALKTRDSFGAAHAAATAAMTRGESGSIDMLARPPSDQMVEDVEGFMQQVLGGQQALVAPVAELSSDSEDDIGASEMVWRYLMSCGRRYS